MPPRARSPLWCLVPAVLTAVGACTPPAERPGAPAAAATAVSAPSPPLVQVAGVDSVTARRCVTDTSCAEATVVLPRLVVAPDATGADAAALAPVLAALADTLRTRAGVPAGRSLSAHVDAVAARLHRDLRQQRRRSPDWEGGYLHAVTARVAWASARVLTVEVEETAFTGGAHGQYEAMLRSYDLRTGAAIPVTAMVADTAALVPLLEAGFVRAKAEDAAAPPPLRELLFPEVQRLPVPGNAGIVAEGVRFLYNPYDVAPWAVGRTDVVLTWAQLGARADRTRWGG